MIYLLKGRKEGVNALFGFIRLFRGLQLIYRLYLEQRRVMESKELYRHLLGISKPWTVEQVNLEWYAKQGRDAKGAMACAFASGGYTLKEIAEHFGVHYSTVSWAVQEQEEA